MNTQDNDSPEVKSDTIEIGTPIPFKPNPWMQVPSFALTTHLDNLIATYGIDAVTDTMRRYALTKVG